MRLIYSAAKETTIFLGQATEGSNALLHAIQDAAGAISLATTKAVVVRSLVKASGLRKAELIEEAFRILWRSYWIRIWIFLGDCSLLQPLDPVWDNQSPLGNFCQALIALLDSDLRYFGAGYTNEHRQRLEDMYWERRAYRHTQGFSQPLPMWDMAGGREFKELMKFLDLLVSKRASKATDSRDMVYALSGIASKPPTWKPLNITYEKSASRVYMR